MNIESKTQKTMSNYQLWQVLMSSIIFLLCIAPSTFAQPGDGLQLSYGSLNWSPDAKKLAFTAMLVKEDYSDYAPEKWRLYIYEFDNKRISKIDDAVIYAAFSPDGKHIAYGKNMQGNWEIIIHEFTSGAKRNITNHPAKDNAPTWSPDGKRIAFNSERDGSVEIYVMRSDGTNITRITRSEGFKSYNPEWSPTDDRIVYYFEKSDNKDQIYLTDANGSFHKNISADTSHNYFPAWTPDGRIIYTVDDKQIYTMKADGTDKKAVDGIEAFFARYSSSGKVIAYIDNADQTIYVADIDNQKIRGARKVVDREFLAKKIE